jgi:hypothetical protein
MQRNIPLKVPIIQRGVPLYQSAREVNLASEKLSKIISGQIILKKSENSVLAKLCRRSVTEIFPSEASS